MIKLIIECTKIFFKMFFTGKSLSDIIKYIKIEHKIYKTAATTNVIMCTKSSCISNKCGCANACPMKEEVMGDLNE